MNEIIKKRTIAYLIDGIVLIIPLQIGAFFYWDYILKEYSNTLFLMAILYQFSPIIIYFLISELFFSKTIGKKIMNLKVEYKKNRILSAIIRSFSRLIPLEIISFLYFEDKLLHDILSNTSVIIEK